VQSTAKATGQTDRQEIPDKLYFRIGDVSHLAGVKPYVLRYWETEFPSISPKKSGTGHRLYRRKDVELILEIKHLLYEKRFTIEGARKAIETRGKPAAAKAASLKKASQAPLFGGPPAQDLTGIRLELQQILEILR
jgi:DNA-binding transcriptional MerR regulator